MSILQDLKTTRVIAAVRDEEGFCRALKSDLKVIFLLKGELLTLADTVRRAHDENKRVLLHLDLVEGIGKDEAAVRYLARVVQPDGIISTKPAVVKAAKAQGLFTVLRAFIIDSQSVDTALANIARLDCDAVEMMPGIMPEIVAAFASKGVRLIIGGLISTRAQIEMGLKKGALAASTSDPQLWESLL